MAYKFAIEEFKNDEFKTLYEDSGVSLFTALDEMRCFVMQHKDGYLLDGDVSSHPVEYEVDGAELSCWIDFDD